MSLVAVSKRGRHGHLFLSSASLCCTSIWNELLKTLLSPHRNSLIKNLPSYIIGALRTRCARLVKAFGNIPALNALEKMMPNILETLKHRYRIFNPECTRVAEDIIETAELWKYDDTYDFLKTKIDGKRRLRCNEIIKAAYEFFIKIITSKLFYRNDLTPKSPLFFISDCVPSFKYATLIGKWLTKNSNVFFVDEARIIHLKPAEEALLNNFQARLDAANTGLKKWLWNFTKRIWMEWKLKVL